MLRGSQIDRRLTSRHQTRQFLIRRRDPYYCCSPGTVNLSNCRHFRLCSFSIDILPGLSYCHNTDTPSHAAPISNPHRTPHTTDPSWARDRSPLQTIAYTSHCGLIYLPSSHMPHRTGSICRPPDLLSRYPSSRRPRYSLSHTLRAPPRPPNTRPSMPAFQTTPLW